MKNEYTSSKNENKLIHEKIKNNYNESIRILRKARDEGQLVIFVGAGVSKASGIPLWKEVVDKIAEHLNIEVDNVDTLKIPQYYYNAREKNEYNKLIKEILLADKDIETNELHNEIIKIDAHTIITTNYDNLIERAAEDNSVFLDVISCDSDLAYRSGEKELIKMHGDFIHDNIVLKEDDYYSYSRNFRLIENYVKSFVGTKVVLFLGYSFSDPDIKHIFGWVKNILNDDFQPAYLFDVENDYDPNEEAYYKKFGINVMYSSVMFPDDNSEEDKSKKLHTMIKKINESNPQSDVDKIYDRLRVFEKMKYAYGKTIESDVI
ncbi:SIR2 family protein [Eubacterium xylanophilum]|uniref:SIR2 family protein n=1 Tax=Eubacterium xylanophilum TaxID=39497 RepID=UPI000479916A|nr:SIR2 family protein [Eubacterium xylanophilum]